MNYKEIFYPETRFGGFTDIDGTIAFYKRVNALIEPKHVVLDVGCGRGNYGQDSVSLRRDLRIFKGKASKIIGLDVDESAKGNPYIDEFHLLQDKKWPIPDNSVNLIVCDNVVEHIADPEIFFAEMWRVLRDGGYVCIRTPNRWNYFAIASSLIPNKYHSRVAAFAHGTGKNEVEDIFPTFYRCNTIGKLKKTMKQNNFDCVIYGYDAEPSYLSFSKIAYLFGVLHQKFAPKYFKAAIFIFGRKITTS